MIEMIRIITRETDKEPCVIIVFGHAEFIIGGVETTEIRYMLTKSGTLSIWKPFEDGILNGRWEVLRE